MRILLLKSGLWYSNCYWYKKRKEIKILLPHQFIEGTYLRQKRSHLPVRTSAPDSHGQITLPQSTGKLENRESIWSSHWLRNDTNCALYIKTRGYGNFRESDFSRL